MLPPIGPCPAKIMIVGEAPGLQEIQQGQPFVGASGQELSLMLTAAGIMRSSCFITNVCRVRPKGNNIELFFAKSKKAITNEHVEYNGKHVLPPIIEGIELLKKEISLCDPNIIIALGNVAMWALTGQWGITKWRGSQLTTNIDGIERKVIPTYHPAAILRMWSWRQIMIRDLEKVKAEQYSLLYENRPNYYFITRPDFIEAKAKLHSILSSIEQKPTWLSVDIETRFYHISCIGFAWDETAAICIPIMKSGSGEERHYWTLDEEVELITIIRAILTNPNCKVIGQNFIFDAQYIYRYWGFIPNLQFDTMTAQHSLFSNMPKALHFLASMYAKFYIYWKDEGKELSGKVNDDKNWEYNCKDCCYTFEVAMVLRKLIKEMGLKDVNDFQQSLFLPVLNTMIKGIRCLKETRAEFAVELHDEIAKREQYFIDVLGHPLNPRSSPQMQKLFYHDLNQKRVLKRSTRRPSCDNESLSIIAAREPLLAPLCNAISGYRSLSVFLSTFISAPLDADNRIRCSFGISGTETYRFNSKKNAFGSGLNLQNIPSGEETDNLKLPNVKKIFIPDPGYDFFDIDLDSADLRIVCAEADIPEMRSMLEEGKKVYVEVAKEYYHDPSITKHHPSYRTFKGLCHGTHYLGTARGLAQRLGLIVHEIEKIQKWYFGKFPELLAWHERFKRQLVEKRYVENVFGYRCYLFDRLGGTIFNQYIAWIPQSTVACIINRGYVNIHANLKKDNVQVLLQVHDSLAGQFPSHKRHWAKRKIIENCLIPLPYKNPITIPVDIKVSSKSWGDCK